MPRPIAGLSQDQITTRNKGIGSSDAAAAVGLNPWKTPAQLWLEKTGRVVPPDISDIEHVHFGNVLEDVVAEEFTRRNGVKVRQRHKSYVKGIMIANVDRLILDGRLLECKNASEYTSSKWAEGPPIHYRIQVEHQLICADKNEAVLAALVGGNRYVQFEIQRNPEMSKFLIAKELEFWQCVERDVPPAPSSANDVIALHPIDNAQGVVATPEMRELHAKLFELKKNLKEIKEQEKNLQEQIQLFIGENAELLVSPEGKPLATWKTDRGTLTTNWKQAFEELAEMQSIDKDQFLSNHQYLRRSRRFLLKEDKSQ